MDQQAFYLDGGRCTGCKTCVYACRDYYGLDTGFSYRKTAECVTGDTVRTEEGVHQTTCEVYAVSFSCNHCDRPACVEVCPTGAMHRDERLGLIQVEPRKCIGCGYCHLSCPYGAPKVDRRLGRSVKCTGCQERVLAGLSPLCVEACPVRALDFGPREVMEHRGSRASCAPFPPSSETEPNLFLNLSPQAVPAEEFSGEVENASLWRGL